jgi:uncharacterized membrane protein
MPDGLPPALDNVLRSSGIDPNNPDVVRTAELTLQITSLSLPLPPPEVLSEYERSFPGLVNRLIAWTDEQRKHRFRLEARRAEREERRLDRAQIFAAIISIVGLALSAYVSTAASSFGYAVSNWIVPCVIAVVAIGGPTAAVYLARRNLKEAPKSD